MGHPFLAEHIFDYPLFVPIAFFGAANATTTLLIVLLFALVILNEPIQYLFEKNKDEHTRFEVQHFWRSLLFIPLYVVPLLWVMYQFGIFEVYYSTNVVGFMILQFVAMVVLHDTYFYFCHRLFHGKKLWHIHSVHHQSVDTTVITSHVFHVAETAVNYLFLIFFSLLAGILFGGLYYLPSLVFVVYTIAWNVYLHGRKNLLPQSVTKSFFGKAFFWPSDHILHHKNGTGNFGFIFTFWDRIFRTKT